MSSSKIIRGDEATQASAYHLSDMDISIRQKLETARIKAESMLQKARQEKKSIEMDAYNRGIEQGQEQGQKMAVKRLEPLFTTLEQALADLAQARLELNAVHEKTLVAVCLLIAEKIVQHEIAIRPDTILDVVRAASEHLSATDEIRLRLNPSDYEYIREIEDILGRRLSDSKQVHIIQDPGIGRGGAVLETAFGDIDATIESQLEHIKTTVSGHE